MASRLAGSGSHRAPRAFKRQDYIVLVATSASVGALLFTDALGCATSSRSSFLGTGTSGDGGQAFDSSSPSSSSDSGSIMSGYEGDGSSIGVVMNQEAGSTGSTDCPPSAGKYIFVVDDQNELYTFDPTKVPA